MNDDIKKIRTLFLSDFHIGYKGFDAPAAIHCLKTHDFKMLYLLGDIFDGWKLAKRWYWNADYTELFDVLMDKQKKGVKIFYTPGNHDDQMRLMLRNPFEDFVGDIRQNARIIALRSHLRIKYKVRIDDKFTHITKDGKKIRVMHGDQFDSRVIEKISKPADYLYEFLVNREILSQRSEKQFSMGKAIAVSGTSYLSNRVKKAAYKRIKDAYDGIIFGHTHDSCFEMKKGILIVNTGSFTHKPSRAQNHTAVIEELDGTLSPIQIPMMRHVSGHPAMACVDHFAISSRHKETRQIAQFAHKIWSPAHPSQRGSSDIDTSPSRHERANRIQMNP